MCGASKRLLDCWIKAISVLMLFCACLIPTESYGQTPTPLINSEKQKAQTTTGQKKATADQRGTEKSPLIIKVVPTPITQEEAERDRKEREDKAALERLVFWLNGLLVLFTAILATFTARLWYATEKLVKGAQDTAERQLRAYVSAEAEMMTSIQSANGPSARVRIKNCGKTPAYDLIQVGGIGLGVSFATLPAPTGPHGITKASLSPGATTDHFDSIQRSLSPQAIAALRAGTSTLWVYGEIRYTDAFKIARFKKYRFMIGGHVGVPGNRMAICEEGNEEN